MDNYFIQKFDFKAGRSAIEDIKNIDMEVMNLIIDEPTISFKTILEGMKVSIVLKKVKPISKTILISLTLPAS